MSKKLMKLLAGMFILVMVVAGCSTIADEEVAETAGETMEKDDMEKEEMKDEEMMDDDMDKEEDMEAHSDDMDKEDDMDDHSDEEMKDDDMDKEDDMSEESMEEDKMEETMMTNDGKMAPEYELMDINGNLVSSADLKGDKVYLKYWASWCSICLSGLGEVDELFLEADGFVPYTVVTPGANGEQSKEDFINWFNGLGYENINVLFDMDGSVAKELGIRAFPTSVFIGSDGVLIQSLPGHKSNDDIKTTIDSFY
jgi:peroxiredoxin